MHRERQWLPPAPDASARRGKRFRERFRVPSAQAGRPVKAGIVREELFDWFCVLKRSVQGRIPVAFVLQKATMLVEDYVLECARRGIEAHAPVLSPDWLRDWRLSYGVSFRKPNRKWKR